MPDRIKEAVFNRLTSLGMLAQDPPGEPWYVADAFAGTGSMGLEMLSRGAAHCTFVETDRDAGERLEDNLESLGLSDRGTLAPGSAMMPFWSAYAPGPLRIISLDPPYTMTDEPRTHASMLELVDQLHESLEPGGVTLLRTKREVEVPESKVYDGQFAAHYGTMTVHFFQRSLEETHAPGNVDSSA